MNFLWRVFAIATIIYVLLIAALAATDALSVTPAEVAADAKIAEAYWNGPPPGCKVTFAATVRGFGGRPYAGLAVVPPYGSTDTFCWMQIYEGLPPRYACYTVVHEYGHWMGLWHSADGASIMFDGDTRWQHVRLCDKAYPHKHTHR